MRLHIAAIVSGDDNGSRWPTPRRERRWLPAVVLLAGVIILADALIGDQSLSTGHRARKQFASVGAEIATLREQNNRLRSEIRRLREDPATIEYVARKDLGLARRGEILFVLK